MLCLHSDDVVLDELTDTKELAILRNNTDVCRLTKPIFSINEALALVEDVEQNPDNDVVNKTVAATKYIKTYKIGDATTSYVVNLIHPQTPHEISKYTHQVYRFFYETPELYKQITIPYKNQEPPREWINDYLTDKQKPLLRGDGYFLVPDIKWDMKDMKLFYGICFTSDTTITSVRVLRQQHVAFLEKMKKEVLKYIKTVSNLDEEEIVIYIHYHPSFWHFHVHFTSLYFPTLARNNAVGKAILLDTVIENIKADDLYYEKATLMVSLGTSHALHDQFEKYDHKNSDTIN
ncbi:Scavenger mRNA decapping enzyme [Entamoeba marina]